MYRRIELIRHDARYARRDGQRDEMAGLDHMESQDDADTAVRETWFSKLRGPVGKRSGAIPRNARFYFTELGWKLVGRGVVAALQRHGKEYRILAVKHRDVHVVWRDEHLGYEVAVQPKKQREQR